MDAVREVVEGRPLPEGARLEAAERIEWATGVADAYAPLATWAKQLPAVHVGGLTALAAEGAGQFVRLGRGHVWLFSGPGVRPPLWFRRYRRPRGS